MSIQSNDNHINQQNFRHILHCFSHPGEKRELLINNKSTLTASIWQFILVTCDNSMTVYIDADLLNDQLKESFLLYCPIKLSDDIQSADFVIINKENITEDLLNQLNVGTRISPEQSSTLLINCVNHNEIESQLMSFSGPGVDGSKSFQIPLLPDFLWQWRAQIEFPLGVDIVLCDEFSIQAIARSTTINKI